MFSDCVSSQIQTWLQEHQEMINSSTTWMAEAQSWLAAPCTYTTAKCLSNHVQALQVSITNINKDCCHGNTLYNQDSIIYVQIAF